VLAVRSPRLPLVAKEHLSLSLFIIFSYYLCLTHDIARVLLGSFMLPIFVSTIFSNVKITRWMFILSCIALLLLGVKGYLTGKLDSILGMQLFVGGFIFLSSYLLANVLIRYGSNNLAALRYSDHQQRYMQEQLRLDPFTGLLNRKTFDDDLNKLMGECEISGKCLSLAMIDVDHFKSVNDRYGHAVGDGVLLYLAQILKSIEAENIHAFRMGGEEFAILFRDCDEEEAYKVCSELRTRMESASLRDIDESCVTFSCGLVCSETNHTNSEALTIAADSALYAAKNNGRNQVVIYNGSMQCANQNQGNH
jgi:diguanylate cyclase (GGDEF)-like protein